MLNLKAFEREKFSVREKEFTLDTLLELAAEADDPDRYGDGKIILKGLTAQELSLADEASDKSKELFELAEKLLAGASKERVDALMGEVAGSKDQTRDFCKQLEIVRLGIKEPEASMAFVIKLAESVPAEFRSIWREVMGLTGKGQTAQVKRKPSGGKRTSKPA